MTNPLDGVNSWLYHLGNVDAAEAARIGANNAGLVIVDYAHDGASGTVAETPAELDVMRGGKDKLIVSYLSIGEAEDYRPYWQSSWNTNPPDFLSASNPEWPDNFKVKYWDTQWQAIIFDYVDKIVASGFNGVYMDIIDAYQYWEGINPVPGMNYAQEMADFVAAIKAHAEQRLAALGDTRDFVIMGQNGEELLDNPTYLNALDGVGKEDLRFYYPNGSEGSFKPVPDGWWSGSKPYLELAEAAGVQVFVVEYMTQARQSQYAGTLAAEIQYLTAHGIPLYVSEDRDLTGIYPQPGGIDPTIYGSALGENVNGTALADMIFALAGNDHVMGLDGNDTLVGGTGADILDGGTGADTASYQSAAASVTVSLIAPAANTGDALGDTFISIENLSGSAFADALQGDDSDNAIYGADGNDELYGGGGADYMSGGNGGDYLSGGAGAETFFGGAGVDTIVGGAGDDLFYILPGDGGDIIVEYAGQGNDRILTAISYSLSSGSEIETLSTDNNAGVAAINLTGNTLDNIIIGNNGVNVLDGGLGNDTLYGLGGAADYFTFSTVANTAANSDVIADWTSGGDLIFLDNAAFTGMAPGFLAASAFLSGADLTAAATAAQRVVVNTTNGDLWWDQDGVGGIASVRFANIGAGHSIVNYDFYGI